MQLDRRRLVAAGIGVSGLAVATRAQAREASQPPPSRSSVTTYHPNSGRDETERLQAAIDSASASGKPVALPSGRFLVRTLKLPSGARLSGSGPATVLQHLGGGPIISGRDARDIRVENISIVGGSPLDPATRGLAEFHRVRDLELRDIRISASPQHGIVMERCSGVVTACRITDAEKAGIFSTDAEGGLEISHNRLERLGNNGILVWRSSITEDRTIVAMNRIENIAARDGGTGENGNGVNVFRAGNVIVTSNSICDCAFTGVRANSASNVQILSNSIARVGEVAIFAEFSFEGAVISSNIVDGAATGISVTNFDHGGRLAVIQGNLIRNLSLHRGPSDPGGCGIAVEADASVTGNTIEGAPTAGLSIGWGRYCRDIAASGNVIRDCTVGIAVTSEARAGTVLIANNMLSGSARGAIRANDHGRLLGDDLALTPPSTGHIRAINNIVS